jgi:hypothetical protein
MYSKKNIHAFPHFKVREGFDTIFPFDNPEERLERELRVIGLTEENLTKAEKLNAEKAAKLKTRVEVVKAKALKAGVLIDSIESIAYSDAKVDALEKVIERLGVLEKQVEDQLVPWTKSQFKSALPWLLLGIMVTTFGLTAVVSRGSTPTLETKTQVK